MANQYTAIIQKGSQGWFIAWSPEVPAANGQGRTIEEAKEDLAAAIELVLEVEREEAFKELEPGAIKDIVFAG